MSADSDDPLVIQTGDTRRIRLPPDNAPAAEPVTRGGPSEPARAGGRYLALAAAGLVLLLVAFTAQWVATLIEQSPTLGIGAALGSLMVVAGAVGWSTRELRAIARLNSVESLQSIIARGSPAADPRSTIDALRLLSGRLSRLSAYKPGIEQWMSKNSADHPPEEAIRLFETCVLGGPDALALKAVRLAARDAFGLVALSPTPLTDTALFVSRALRLVRQVGEAYGYRPTKLSALLLTRRILQDVSIVTMADFAGDAMAGFLGGKVLEKVSAAAAGGAIAGQRMARFGLLTIDCCRPLAHDPAAKPSIGSVIAPGQVSP
jgi:putative membrane protein